MPFTLPQSRPAPMERPRGGSPRALIPMYAPDWTDHNPATAIIEMLAWVIEQDVYRANRITARHRAAFLALLGERPYPLALRASHCGYAGRRAEPAPAGVYQAGTEFETISAVGDLATFVVPPRTSTSFRPPSVRSWSIQAKGRCATRQRRPGDAVRCSRASAPAPTHRDGIVYLGLQQALPAGAEITLLGGDPADDAVRAATPRDEAARLANARRRVAVALQWEAYTGGRPDWVALPPERAVDDTRGFTISGRVRMRLTEPLAANALGVMSRGDTPWPQPPEARWLRCRGWSGGLDAAPWLAGIDLNGTFASQLERGVGTERLSLPRGSASLQRHDDTATYPTDLGRSSRWSKCRNPV